jgi:predicted acyl esterase
VLTFTGDVLTAPVKISGVPAVHLAASTSGTDSDWVVKLIDVYPDQVADRPDLGGYQLAVAMDIFRGRYRESFVTPKALVANQPLAYQFALPATNHVFLPGHRITFVPSIFEAKPADYQKATQRIYHSAEQASYIALPVIGG